MKKSIKDVYMQQVIKEAGAPIASGGISNAISNAPFDATTQQKLVQSLGLGPAGGMNKETLAQLMSEIINSLDDNVIANAYQNAMKKSSSSSTTMTSR